MHIIEDSSSNETGNLPFLKLRRNALLQLPDHMAVLDRLNANPSCCLRRGFIIYYFQVLSVDNPMSHEHIVNKHENTYSAGRPKKTFDSVTVSK